MNIDWAEVDRRQVKDLIRDQQAEIERLKDGNRKVSEMYARTNDMLCEVVAENTQLRAVVEAAKAFDVATDHKMKHYEDVMLLNEVIEHWDKCRKELKQALRAAGEE